MNMIGILLSPHQVRLTPLAFIHDTVHYTELGTVRCPRLLSSLLEDRPGSSAMDGFRRMAGWVKTP